MITIVAITRGCYHSHLLTKNLFDSIRTKWLFIYHFLLNLALRIFSEPCKYELKCLPNCLQFCADVIRARQNLRKITFKHTMEKISDPLEPSSFISPLFQYLAIHQSLLSHKLVYNGGFQTLNCRAARSEFNLSGPDFV